MNKTKNNTFVLDIKSNQKDQCAEFNCIKLGEYKAPFSRKNINTYIYFCLEHVREYNRKWNYYEGLNDSEIESEIRKATTWERPSWPIRNNIHKSWDKINFNFRDFDSINDQKTENNFLEIFSQKEINAFKTLEVSPTKCIEDIKKAYKRLVKKYHPDHNIGNKEFESKIKDVNQAYNELKNIK